ncbi:transposase [Micromonospora inyonensis]|uniref:transposase n=1 Tax=Micromonospora inyonensis TaxID=47866 RepID=UPI000B80E455|nr:transposase [Micromonospora inyonensis]
MDEPKPPIRQSARQLDVRPEALRSWIRQDEAERADEDGTALGFARWYRRWLDSCPTPVTG